MIIPWATDAPIYHRPWATLLMMAVMVGAFAVQVQLDEEVVESYMLSHGDGLHPVQWITSNFMHADIFHLVGNMIFLWAFALVVEGKVGFFPFLAIFVGVGAIEAAALQALALGREEVVYSLGASGAIYGLIAMALVWAPKNDLSCIMFWRFRILTFDMPIMGFAGLYLALQVLGFVLQGGQMSSELLHLAGAVVGFILGTVLLKMDRVDCEKWDLYSVWRGHAGRDRPKVAKKVKLPVFSTDHDAPDPADEGLGENVRSERGVAKAKGKKAGGKAESVPVGAEARADAAADQMRRAIEEGNAAAALAFHDKARKARPSWRPADADWLGLIQVLSAAKDWDNAVAAMEDYLDRAMKPSDRVRLRLAQVLIREQQRPAHALGVLDAIPGGALAPDLEAARQRLRAQAEQMRDDGVLELDGKAW